MQQKEWKELEKIVDRQGIRAVLYSLSVLCYEKSEHIAQDKPLAKKWLRVSNKISKVLPLIDTP